MAPDQDYLFDNKKFSGAFSFTPVGVVTGTNTVQPLPSVAVGPVNASKYQAYTSVIDYMAYPGMVRPVIGVSFQVQDANKPKESHRLVVNVYVDGVQKSETSFSSATMSKDAQGYWSGKWEVSVN